MAETQQSSFFGSNARPRIRLEPQGFEWFSLSELLHAYFPFCNA